jgi:hypothetical protein
LPLYRYSLEFYSVLLKICRLALLLLWKRFGTTRNGLGTTIKDLRRIASGAAGYCLGATIKYLNGSCIGLGTTIMYLPGAMDIGLGTTI